MGSSMPCSLAYIHLGVLIDMKVILLLQILKVNLNKRKSKTTLDIDDVLGGQFINTKNLKKSIEE